MEIMYKGQVNSPQTNLVNDITAIQTTIEVVDASVLPTAPNILVIGGDTTTSETVYYASATGNVLTVIRAYEGTAQIWASGVTIGRNFTAYDYNTLVDNVDEVNTTKINTAQIANNLTETVAGKVLDATQGKIINDNLTAHKADYTALVTEVDEVKRTVGMGLIDVDSWDIVQQIVRDGNASKYFNVGDQFIVPYKSVNYVADVIGINHDIPTDVTKTHSLTLQFHDCLLNAQFSNSQALYYATAGLAAGTYYFTYSGVNYQFTLTSPVPAGGQLAFPWVYNTEILTTKIVSYASKLATAPIESISIIIGGAGTQLIELNHMDRCRYGSNNYKDSGIRQWLNSNDEAFVWQSKTNYDRPSTYETKGFLKLLDPDLVAVLGSVNKQVARNTVNESGGQDTFSDKIFLLSRKEIYGANEGVVIGESVYPYYSQFAAAVTDAAVPWRIKYLTGSPRYWWLRSPYVSNSYTTRYVGTTGLVVGTSATSSYGIAPACVIV